MKIYEIFYILQDEKCLINTGDLGMRVLWE